MKSFAAVFTAVTAVVIAASCTLLPAKKSSVLYKASEIQGKPISLRLRNIEYQSNLQWKEGNISDGIKSSAEALLAAAGKSGIALELDISLQERETVTGSGVSRKSETCVFLKASAYIEGSDRPVIVYLFTESGDHSLSEGYYQIRILKKMLNELNS